MPKFTVAQIQRELELLEQSEAQAAPYYLKLELTRRQRSTRNTGRPVKNDTAKHKAWREASQRYRMK